MCLGYLLFRPHVRRCGLHLHSVSWCRIISMPLELLQTPTLPGQRDTMLTIPFTLACSLCLRR